MEYINGNTHTNSQNYHRDIEHTGFPTTDRTDITTSHVRKLIWFSNWTGPTTLNAKSNFQKKQECLLNLFITVMIALPTARASSSRCSVVQGIGSGIRLTERSLNTTWGLVRDCAISSPRCGCLTTWRSLKNPCTCWIRSGANWSSTTSLFKHHGIISPEVSIMMERLMQSDWVKIGIIPNYWGFLTTCQ